MLSDLQAVGGGEARKLIRDQLGSETLKRVAVVIGAESYAHYAPTKHCHADAKLVCGTLTSACDFEESSVRSYMLEPGDGITATRILQELSVWITSSEPGSTVLFYFAGHGTLHEGNAYLLLPDSDPKDIQSSAIGFRELSSALRGSERLCFRILDACHSGFDTRTANAKVDAEGFLRSVETQAKGWVTLAACREDERSVSDDRIGHGIFTYHLCEHIKGLPPRAPIRPDEIRPVIEQLVSQHSRALGFTQTITLNGSLSGDMSFANRRELERESIPQESMVAGYGLLAGIAQMRGVESAFDQAVLTELLRDLAAGVGKTLGEELPTEVARLSPWGFGRIDDLDDQVKDELVDYISGRDWAPRHGVRRYEEEVPLTTNEMLAAYGLGLSGRATQVKTREIRAIWQVAGSPDSVAVSALPGDSRSVPNAKVISYILPLQVSCVLFLLAYVEGFPPLEHDLDLLCLHSHQVRAVPGPARLAEVSAAFSREVVGKLTKRVFARLRTLKRELGQA